MFNNEKISLTNEEISKENELLKAMKEILNKIEGYSFAKILEKYEADENLNETESFKIKKLYKILVNLLNFYESLLFKERGKK